VLSPKLVNNFRILLGAERQSAASVTDAANARPAGVTRNSLQGPGFAGLALRWSRDFFLVKGKKKDGGVKATLALDAFNVLNRVNYTGFVGNLSSPFFGRAVAAQPPRRLQLSFRVKFYRTLPRARFVVACRRRRHLSFKSSGNARRGGSDED
jgi:hypothetical protein